MSIHISNRSATQTKIDFITSHLDETHIVVDFDGTLTQYFDEQGKSRPSIISLLRDENILDEDYSMQAKAMHAKYSVIEHDKSLPLPERQDSMYERWTTHKELLMKKGLNMKHIEGVMRMDKIIIRKGTEDFLRRANALHIPVIIFSASGIGTDSISYLLKHRQLDLPNIDIVSNTLYRDDNGNMIGYDKAIIHGLNKTEDVLQSPEYEHIKKKLEKRPHTILVGDGLGDATMAIETEQKTVLKIGLCNDKVDERLTSYAEVFDIIITHDDSLEEVTNILLS